MRASLLWQIVSGKVAAPENVTKPLEIKSHNRPAGPPYASATIRLKRARIWFDLNRLLARRDKWVPSL